MILHSADYLTAIFSADSRPGAAPSTDLAWRLAGGADFVVQLHLRPTGRVRRGAPLIGLYFTSQPAGADAGHRASSAGRIWTSPPARPITA
jgi:hypothetical protein